MGDNIRLNIGRALRCCCATVTIVGYRANHYRQEEILIASEVGGRQLSHPRAESLILKTENCLIFTKHTMCF